MSQLLPRWQVDALPPAAGGDAGPLPRHSQRGRAKGPLGGEAGGAQRHRRLSRAASLDVLSTPMIANALPPGPSGPARARSRRMRVGARISFEVVGDSATTCRSCPPLMDHERFAAGNITHRLHRRGISRRGFEGATLDDEALPSRGGRGRRDAPRGRDPAHSASRAGWTTTNAASARTGWLEPLQRAGIRPSPVAADHDGSTVGPFEDGHMMRVHLQDLDAGRPAGQADGRRGRRLVLKAGKLPVGFRIRTRRRRSQGSISAARGQAELARSHARETAARHPPGCSSATMPGLIREVDVAEGDEVQEGLRHFSAAV